MTKTRQLTAAIAANRRKSEVCRTLSGDNVMFSDILNFDGRKILLATLLGLFCAGAALAQTTTITYQGRLTDGVTPANGNYDFQFALWDSLSAGTQIGST